MDNSRNGAVSRGLFVGMLICLGIATVVGASVAGFELFKKLSLEGEKVPAVKVASTGNFFKKMEAELETVIANDILETRGEGLLVVDRNNGEREFVHYHKLGSPVTENATANKLARRVVRVYRVKTPEWKKLIVDLYKVSAELSKQQ